MKQPRKYGLFRRVNGMWRRASLIRIGGFRLGVAKQVYGPVMTEDRSLRLRPMPTGQQNAQSRRKVR
jgi:hypothetical protein